MKKMKLDLTWKDESRCKSDRDRLRLSVTRTWGNRTLPVKSKEWRKLREDVIRRYGGRCRFCGSKFTKYLVCDHMDGNASNNDPSNLGINCRLCDWMRHCGLSGLKGMTVMRKSKLDQVEIVKRTYRYYLENKCWPKPEEIDDSCGEVFGMSICLEDGTIVGKVEDKVERSMPSPKNFGLKSWDDVDGIKDPFMRKTLNEVKRDVIEHKRVGCEVSTVTLANVLMRHDYNELRLDAKSLRGYCKVTNSDKFMESYVSN